MDPSRPQLNEGRRGSFEVARNCWLETGLKGWADRE